MCCYFFKKEYNLNIPVEFFDDNRTGDHIWWITDYSKFSKDFPKWKIRYKLDKILKNIASHEIEKSKL